MLTVAEIRQLSDRDARAELARARDLLFRQQIGVRTGHLKDSHLIKILKNLIARLLTVINARVKTGEKVETSSAEITQKLKAAQDKLEQSQTPKAAKTTAKKESVKSAEVEKDVKVKVVEKKGLLDKITGKKEKEA